MLLEGVTEEGLKRALSSILAARSIESSALLQLDVVTARVGQARAEARERELALAEVLVRIARAELVRFRSSSAASGEAPEIDGDPRSGIAFDFQCSSIEQESWSCLYYRYLAATPLPVQDIAAVVQPGSPHGRRLVSRRLARGYALLLRALGAMEQRSQAERAGGTDAHGELAPPREARGAGAPRLPNPLGRFVGRETQLAYLREHLGRARLVTLVGPGGVGKTRLALRLGAEHASTPTEAVAFVDLAALSESERLPRAIASAIGIRSAPSGREIEVIIEVLDDRPWLLLLDNCEHLVEPAARIARTLLEAVPSLCILATSREALRVPGEQVAPIPPLDLPVSAADDEASRSEAVRLFADRARASQPTFVVDEANLPSVVAICRRLDGLPLAIELAASRVRTLAPPELARRLDLLLPSGGAPPRATEARQQTLWAAIGWSYDLLSEEERRAFRRLAVFPGSFGLDAARAVLASPAEVGADGGADGGRDVGGDVSRDVEADVDEVLEQLVAKSMVRTAALDDGTQLRMLETIRAFAHHHLLATGEMDGARDALLGWCAVLVDEAEPHLSGTEQVPWLNRIDREMDTIAAAVEHALRGNGAARETAARIVAGLDMFGLYRGHGLELAGWLDRLLADPADFDARLRARLAMAAAVVAIADKRSTDAQRHAEAALAGYDSLGDASRVSHIRYLLGTALHHRSRNDEATRELELALEGFRAQGDRRMVGRCLGLLSGIELDRHRIDESMALIDESIAILRQHGNPHDQPIGALNRAMTLRYAGRLAEACTQLEESRALYTSIGSAPGVALSDANLGVAYEDLGRIAEARPAYARAERYYRDQGNVCMRALVQTNLVVLARLEGRERELLPEALKSLRLACRCGTDRVRLMALAVCSRCAFDGGRPRLAFQLLAAVRRLFEQVGTQVTDRDFIEELLPTDAALEDVLQGPDARRLAEAAHAADLDTLIDRLAEGRTTAEAP